MQRSDESLETFYSRLRELGAHCKFEKLEEDLVKEIFISNLRSSNIQMELLSEVRTPQQALNYAINRERGQANQQEILKANTSWNTGSSYTNGLHSTNETTNIIWSTKMISMLEMWKHIFNGPPPNIPRKKMFKKR